MSGVCNQCGSHNVFLINGEDEDGHIEEWLECRDCGSDDILDINVEE